MIFFFYSCNIPSQKNKAMNTTDFSLLFPEVDNPGKMINTLVGTAHSRHLPEHEFYSILHDISLKRNNYEGYAQNPCGYITRCFENACNDYFKEERKTTSLNENQIIETHIEPDFDAKDFIEKLAEFDSKIATYNLTHQEFRVYQILKEVAKNEHRSMVKYFKEVREKAALENIAYVNVRKILERIREKLRSATDLRNSMMGFIQIQNPEIVYFLNALINLDDSYDNSEIEEFIKKINSKFIQPLPQEFFNEIVLVVKLCLNSKGMLKDATEINDFEKDKFQHIVENVNSILDSEEAINRNDNYEKLNVSLFEHLCAAIMFLLTNKDDIYHRFPNNAILDVIHSLMPQNND
jgi:hypothetical protein